MKTPNNKAQASNFLTDREKMGGTSHQTSEKEMGSDIEVEVMKEFFLLRALNIFLNYFKLFKVLWKP